MMIRTLALTSGLVMSVAAAGPGFWRTSAVAAATGENPANAGPSGAATGQETPRNRGRSLFHWVASSDEESGGATTGLPLSDIRRCNHEDPNDPCAPPDKVTIVVEDGGSPVPTPSPTPPVMIIIDRTPRPSPNEPISPNEGPLSPTPKPTDDCIDDMTWYRDRWTVTTFNCTNVGLNPDEFCDLRGGGDVHGGTPADVACKKSCGKCFSDTIDINSSSPTKFPSIGAPTHIPTYNATTYWPTASPINKDAKCEDNPYWYVKEVASTTTNSPEAAYPEGQGEGYGGSSPGWYVNKKDCKWVSQDTKSRCEDTIKGSDGTSALEACPHTCDTCDDKRSIPCSERRWIVKVPVDGEGGNGVCTNEKSSTEWIQFFTYETAEECCEKGLESEDCMIHDVCTTPPGKLGLGWGSSSWASGGSGKAGKGSGGSWGSGSSGKTGKGSWGGSGKSGKGSWGSSGKSGKGSWGSSGSGKSGKGSGGSWGSSGSGKSVKGSWGSGGSGKSGKESWGSGDSANPWKGTWGGEAWTESGDESWGSGGSGKSGKGSWGSSGSGKSGKESWGSSGWGSGGSGKSGKESWGSSGSGKSGKGSWGSGGWSSDGSGKSGKGSWGSSGSGKSGKESSGSGGWGSEGSGKSGKESWGSGGSAKSGKESWGSGGSSKGGKESWGSGGVKFWKEFESWSGSTSEGNDSWGGGDSDGTLMEPRSWIGSQSVNDEWQASGSSGKSGKGSGKSEKGSSKSGKGSSKSGKGSSKSGKGSSKSGKGSSKSGKGSRSSEGSGSDDCYDDWSASGDSSSWSGGSNRVLSTSTDPWEQALLKPSWWGSSLQTLSKSGKGSKSGSKCGGKSAKAFGGKGGKSSSGSNSRSGDNSDVLETSTRTTTATTAATASSGWSDSTPGSTSAPLTSSSLLGNIENTDIIATSNLRPILNDDKAETIVNKPVSIPVLDNDDFIPEGKTGSITQPSNGFSDADGENILYVPDNDFCGTDEFTYTITDVTGQFSDTAKVVVNVMCDKEVTSFPTYEPSTYAPSGETSSPTDMTNIPTTIADSDSNGAIVANDDFVTTNQGTSLEIFVLENDVVPQDAIGSFTNPSNGILDKGTAQLVYTPDASFCGEDQFDYTLTNSMSSDTATVTITVVCNISEERASTPSPEASIAPNAAPVILKAEDDFATGLMNMPLSIPVLANDNIPDDAGGGFNQPQHGLITDPTANGLVYVPNTDWCGHDSFEYNVTSGDLSDSATVTIHILCEGESEPSSTEATGQDPRAVNDEVTILQDSGMIIYDVLQNDITSTSGGALVVDSILYNAQHGVCAVKDGSALEYTPHTGYNGQDNCVYNACEEGGGCDSAVLTITIEKSNIEEMGEESNMPVHSLEQQAQSESPGDSDETMTSSKIAMGFGAALGATLTLAGIIVSMKDRRKDTNSEKFDDSKHWWQTIYSGSDNSETSSLNRSLSENESSREIQFSGSTNLSVTAFLTGEAGSSEKKSSKRSFFGDNDAPAEMVPISPANSLFSAASSRSSRSKKDRAIEDVVDL